MIRGKVLVCCEKPQQSEKIASAFPHKKHKDHIEILPCDILPQGGVVIGACGHLLCAYDPSDYDPKLKEWSLNTLPIIPKDLKFKLKVIESKKFYFNTYKKFLNDSSISMIVHSGDPAQEGQNLIDESFCFLITKSR